MEKLFCEACGANDLIEIKDGVYRCSYCGTRFLNSQLKQLNGNDEFFIQNSEKVQSFLKNAMRVFHSDKYEKAFEFATEALVLAPQNVAALFLAGKSVLYQSTLSNPQFSQAEVFFTEAIDVLNQSEESFYNSFFKTTITELIEDLDSIISFLFKQNHSVFVNEANSAFAIDHYNLSGFDQALEEFEDREYQFVGEFYDLCFSIQEAIMKKEPSNQDDEYFEICRNLFQIKYDFIKEQRHELRYLEYILTPASKEHKLFLSIPSWSAVPQMEEYISSLANEGSKIVFEYAKKWELSEWKVLQENCQKEDTDLKIMQEKLQTVTQNAEHIMSRFHEYCDRIKDEKYKTAFTEFHEQELNKVLSKLKDGPIKNNLIAISQGKQVQAVKTTNFSFAKVIVAILLFILVFLFIKFIFGI